MKLNHDCVRELLLYLEENLQLDDVIDVRNINLKSFSEEEIRYSAVKLHEIQYIDAEIVIADAETEVYISSITWDGHKFLDNVRDPIIWQKSKSIASKLLSVSIGMMENITAQVITNIINQQLGFPLN